MLKRWKTQRHLRDRKRSQEGNEEKNIVRKKENIKVYFLELLRDLTVILNK